MLGKKHPSTSYSAAKHQNAANLGLQTYEKNQQTILWYRTDVDFIGRNIFSNLGSFAKVFVPAKTIIP